MFEGGSSESASERATGSEREREQKRSTRHNRSKTFEGAKRVFMGTVTENKLDEFGTKGREIFLLFVRFFLILLTLSVYRKQGLLYLLVFYYYYY
jgi:hypothetical protein